MTESITTTTKTFKVLGLTIWESKTANVSKSLLSNKKFLGEIAEKIIPTVKDEVSKQIVFSYDSFHQMKAHDIFDKKSSAVNADISELMQENTSKNPRDQVNQQELAKSIQPYTLDELDKILS